MRTWVFLFGGLIVWTVHFFGIYGIASIWLDTGRSRLLSGGLTLLCLAANGWLLWRALPMLRARGSDEVDRWIARVGTLAVLLSLLSVLWQGLPAILS